MIVYAATDGTGVYRSANGGGTWGQTNGGLTNLNVAAVAVSPTTATTVFAGTAGGHLPLDRRRLELDARRRHRRRVGALVRAAPAEGHGRLRQLDERHPADD